MFIAYSWRRISLFTPAVRGSIMYASCTWTNNVDPWFLTYSYSKLLERNLFDLLHLLRLSHNALLPLLTTLLFSLINVQRDESKRNQFDVSPLFRFSLKVSWNADNDMDRCFPVNLLRGNFLGNLFGSFWVNLWSNFFDVSFIMMHPLQWI